MPLYNPSAPPTTTTVGELINSASSKATPVDADQVGLMDSAASNILKKLSWANIKATLKTYFDTLYATIASPTFTTQITTPKITSPASTNLVITPGAGAYGSILGNSTATVGIITEQRLGLYAPNYYPQTPAQITSDQNDYAIDPQGGVIQRLSSDASRNITGIATLYSGNVSGDFHIVVNVGTQNIVLKHEDAGSTAANRFLNSTGADITLAANQVADIQYDATVARWRAFKRN